MSPVSNAERKFYFYGIPAVSAALFAVLASDIESGYSLYESPVPAMLPVSDSEAVGTMLGTAFGFFLGRAMYSWQSNKRGSVAWE